MAPADASTQTTCEPQPLGAAGPWRFERAFAFLFGLLPFAVAVRFPPNSAFWGQWATVTVVLLWLALRPHGARQWPWACIPFALVALWLLVQMALGLSPMPVALLVAVAVAVIAALASTEARSLGSTPRGDALVVGFAAGLLVAFALNVVAVGFELAGYEWLWVVWFKVPAPPARALGLIGQSNHLGALGVYALFAALTLHWTGRLRVWLLWPIVAAAGVICAASASRVAVVVWLAGSFFCLAWLGKASLWDRRRVELLLATTLFAAIQLGWVAQDHSRAGTAQLTRGADVGRGAMLRDAVELWAHHPVMGVGQGNYAAQRLHQVDGPLAAPHADHAHNVFAHAMAEWGSVGLLIVGAAFAYVLWVVWRRLRDPARRPLELLPCVWVLGLTLHSLVEQPLWFAHFLLPFALMLGWLKQPVLAPASVDKRASWGPRFVAAALVAAVCGVAAWDFLRLQVLAMRMLVEAPGQPALVSFHDLARIETLTLFPLQAKVMLARKLPLGSSAGDAKIALARQAMDAVPSAETIARWAAFCAMGDRTAEAQALLNRWRARNPGYYAGTIDLLKTWSVLDPRIVRLVSAAAEPAAPATAAALR